jgi:hypothetical protein
VEEGDSRKEADEEKWEEGDAKLFLNTFKNRFPCIAQSQPIFSD